MKTIFWVESSKEAVRSFPENVRKKAGHELNRVQRGMEPMDWKPMPGIGTGVKEIRIHDGSGYRVIYIAKYSMSFMHFANRVLRQPKKILPLQKPD